MFIPILSFNLTDTKLHNTLSISAVGALTSKPYAFRARPWELHAVERMDPLDSLGSSIRIDVKANTIMRILPIKNDSINSDWITDKIRFAHEAVLVDRALCPMKREKNIMVPCSWDIALYDVWRILHTKPQGVKFEISDVMDWYSMSMLEKLCSGLGVSDVFLNTNSKINHDLRINWLLNSNISEFIKNNQFLFLNTNLKLECSVLHARIYNTQFVNATDKRFFIIGCFYSTNLPITQLGISTTKLLNILEGKNFVCESWYRSSLSCVVGTTQSFFTDIPLQFQSYFHHVPSDVHTSVIASNCTQLNSFELGINTHFKKVNYEVFYYIGTPNISHTDKINGPDASFIIIQSPFFDEKVLCNIFLPTTSFFECENAFFNNQLGFSWNAKVIDAPNTLIRSDYDVFLCLVRMFNQDHFEAFWQHVLLKGHPDTNSSPLEINMPNTNKVFVSNMIAKQWRLETYYNSDWYSAHSKTLQHSLDVIKSLDIEYYSSNH